jgi:hypothetical protein
MENMEENSEKIGKIWKIWKKSKLNSEMIWTPFPAISFS